MKVQFEFSASDMAEVAERVNGNSAVLKEERWRYRAFWGAMVGLIVFLVTPGDRIARIAFAAAFAVAAPFLAQLYTSRPRRDPRMIRYYREQLGGDGPFRCEVEISTRGLTTRQFNSETTRDWSSVMAVTEEQGGIQFRFQPSGALLVRDRAFVTPENRKAFLALAREYVPTQKPS